MNVSGIVVRNHVNARNENRTLQLAEILLLFIFVFSPIRSLRGTSTREYRILPGPPFVQPLATTEATKTHSSRINSALLCARSSALHLFFNIREYTVTR